MTQRFWSNEQLSAFLDGELPQQETEALARDLESDETLAARLERLGSAQAAYTDAISTIDGVAMSPRLKAAMTPPAGARVIAFRPRGVMGFVMEHRAIAASLVCAVAVWGVMSTVSRGASSDPFAPEANGVIMASSPLHRVLELSPTGQASTEGGSTAIPRLTFASADGKYCRQYEVASGGGASAAIACREDGAWRTRIAAYGLPKPAGDFQTASAIRSPALEAFLDEQMSGAPMNAEDEATLLRNGWALRQR